VAVIEYLEAYSAQLDLVQNVEQLYGDLLNWQWAQHTLDGQWVQDTLGCQAQNELNNEFFAAQNAAQLRLRWENPPTTAVGGFNGIVTVAANPGFDDELGNAAEIQIRATPDGNRAFCESFFDAENAGQLTHEISWWQSVARFCHAALEVVQPLPIDDLWEWAAATHCVGGVDLVPFHSARDGVTPLIRNTPRIDNHRANIKWALRSAGKSTFRMVLRLKPKVIFVASAAGTEIAEEVLEDLPDVISEHLLCSSATSDWGHELSYRLRWHQVGETHVVTMPHQLFSGQAGIIRKLQIPIANQIRQILLG
jgi:hypothetical protein